jgi:fucose permease
VSPLPAAADGAPGAHEGLLAAALRDRGVLLAAVFLTVYVGVEMSMGSWGVNYLQEHHGLSEGLAGASLSGYWLGLTVGRFVISPVSTALRWTTARMTSVCLAGVIACGVALGLAPAGLFATVCLALLGFFLGPLFPTAIAVVPQLTSPRLVPTAVGLMNAVSVVGGAALPWLAGTLGDVAGIGTLVPFVTGLAVVQLLVWRAVAAQMRSRA